MILYSWQIHASASGAIRWKRKSNPVDFEGFGRQKFWVKEETPDIYKDTIDVPIDESLS